MDKIERFIENENAFQVMGELKRLGILTKEDIGKAVLMDRAGWLQFMKEKAGIANG